MNAELARGALHGAEPHGVFRAFVHLARPEQVPAYMQQVEFESLGILKVTIDCQQMTNIDDDDNVISVELIEYVSSCLKLA